MKFRHAKNALIVGGSEGIGFSIAKLLLASGRDVQIVGRDSKKLAMALEKLESLYPDRKRLIGVHSVDVTDYTAVQNLQERLFKENKMPEILINCAGFSRSGYLEELDLQKFRDMMEVNYFGTVHTCKAFLPAMKKRGGGIVVNTSSLSGFIGLFGYSGYTATKFAVVGFSQSLFHEYKPYGIHISVLCPPNTKTPGFAEENLTKPALILATESKSGSLHPDQVAKYLLKSVERKKFMIIPGRMGKTAYFLNRLWPQGLAYFISPPKKNYKTFY